MDGNKASVLVVEGDERAAVKLRFTLSKSGYFVPGIASSPGDAVARAGELLPDAVLIDLDLRNPGDGIAAAREIRKRFEVTVIYLVGGADWKIIEWVSLNESHGVLLKPFQDRELELVIETAIARHKMERELKERERWLVATLRSIGYAVIATDARWRVRFMNPRAESLTGWDARVALGCELAEVLRVSLAKEPCPLPLNPFAPGGGTAEGILISRDGRELKVEENSATIRDDQGHVLGTVIAIREFMPTL